MQSIIELKISSSQSVNEILNKVPLAAMRIAFYIHTYHGSGQDKWMDDLACHLKMRGYYTLALISSQCTLPVCFNNVDNIFKIDFHDIRNIEGVDIFIISDVDFWTVYPAKSRVLATSHTLYTNLEDNEFNAYLTGHLDGYIVHGYPDEPLKKRISNFWTGFVSPQYNLRGNSPFYIIPMGYPSLAHEIAQLKQHEKEPDSFLYAPTLIDHALGQGGKRIANYGKDLVSFLLSEFPDKTVIFRPFASNMNHKDVRNLVEHFSSHPNFLFDASPNRNLAFSRSCTVITDISSIHRNFAYSTLRPSICYRPWLTNLKGNIKSPIGYVTASLEGVGIALREILKNSEAYKISIKELRDTAMMSPDTAFEDLADSLNDFLNFTPRKDWITIARPMTSKSVQDFELVKELRLLNQSTCARTALYAFAYHNPHSPLLAAFAFHMARKYLPQIPLSSQMANFATYYLKRDVSRGKGGDIPPEMIRNLYYEALQEYDIYQENFREPLIYELLSEMAGDFPLPRDYGDKMWTPSRRVQFNAWAVGILPRIDIAPRAIVFKCSNLNPDSVLRMEIYRTPKNQPSIELKSLDLIFKSDYRISASDIYDKPREIFYSLDGLKYSKGEPLLVVIHGDKLLGMAQGPEDLNIRDFLFRGYYSLCNLSTFKVVGETRSVGYRLVYE